MIPRTKEEDCQLQIVLPYVPEEKKLSDSEDEVGDDLEDPNSLYTGAPQLPATGHSSVTKRLFKVTPATKLKYTASCESLNSAGSNPPLSDVFEAAQLVEVLAQVGVEPTPQGKETFEVWRDSALTAVADWPGSGPALCCKIQVRLRGPTLDLIKLHTEVFPQDGPKK
ncbi:hypothetical protein XELAEV_18029357mg [Xenopus laevis]|uniref:Uncharacterized protein n=1 Tax=Xenopus laevis TaxID=8355 RepID=A0A974CRF7_XENLA|nr:hypothetical protein XELAEV_18029357mg [Xenopus laevis]